ncbi:hypothetical protein [Burkholderia sp. NLJ2]|uniref:hypothetical protein n=1 Tax=Burkholderia sp. NLJ2 TaxID=3090699 RepID=UPI003C6CAF1C
MSEIVTATENAHRHALATMTAEIDDQLAVVANVLRASQERVAGIAHAFVDGAPATERLLSVGIGDSELVGALAEALAGPAHAHVVSVASDAIAGIDTLPRAALIHSISGTTPVTLAAAGHLEHRGIACVAVTCDGNSPLVDIARRSLVVEIPRYPPDAKVPGTITVLVPLAITLLFVAAMRPGAALPQVVPALLADMSASDGLARARVAEQASVVTGQATTAVQIVSARQGAATAAYLQAKLAETLGVGATVSGLETWLHVFKHAAREGTLVIALDVGREPVLADAVRREAQARGARFCSVRDVPYGTGVGDATCALPLPPAARPRTESLAEFFFAQHVCRALLQAQQDWAPFQRHRLAATVVKGLRQRVYEVR